MRVFAACDFSLALSCKVAETAVFYQQGELAGQTFYTAGC